MQAVKQHKYLKFTSLIDTVFWDFYSLNNSNIIYSKFPLVKLNKVLTHRKGFINISDMQLYKLCRVQIQGKGVVLRDEMFGSEIKTKKQQLCKTDDFLVAEIDAKFGGFGIVPKELEGAIVSGHYFLFEIDKTLLFPDYLGIVVKQADFLKQVKSTGSTNYSAIRPYHVLEYQIPLPPLAEQEKLATNYYYKIKEAGKLQQQANSLEGNIEKYLFNELDFEINTAKIIGKLKGLHFINYSEIDKWGLDFIGKATSNEKKFPEVHIKDICKISSGGTPSRSRKEYYEGGAIPWIKTGELRNQILFDTEEKITHEALKNSSAKLYNEGSLVIAMYGATIGKTAKLGIKATTNQACAVLFDINNKIIDTDYLWEYLQSQVENFKKLAYGSAQPNLNVGIISNYKVPLPSLDKQKEIVSKIILLKKEINLLKTNALKLKSEAEQKFEKTIFE